MSMEPNVDVLLKNFFFLIEGHCRTIFPNYNASAQTFWWDGKFLVSPSDSPKYCALTRGRRLAHTHVTELPFLGILRPKR